MKQTATQFISREHVTSVQIQNLLNAFNVTSGFLFHAEDRDGGELDGGTKTAVENTVCGICARIDAVISDESRWSMKEQETLEAALCEAYKQNAAASEAQAKAYVNSIAPHTQYAPKLAKLLSGDWVAFLGDLNDINSAVVGMGKTPEQAIIAFDALFKGEVPEHLAHLLAEREAQQHEKQQLDGQGQIPTQKPPRKRRKRGGDNEGDAPQPQGS